MGSSTKHKVAIVIVGEIHSDPVTPNLLLQAIRKIKEEKIKMIFCEEAAENYTLEQTLEGNKEIVENNNLLIPEHGLREFLINDPILLRPYFRFSNFQPICDRFSHAYPTAPSHQIETQVHELMRHNNFIESIKLKQYLCGSDIPYQGLESSSVQREEDIKEGLMSKVLSTLAGSIHEDKRAKKMALKVLSNIEKLWDDGILFVRCGMEHVNDIAKFIRENLSPHHANYDIRIETLCPHSLYVKDNGISGMEEAFFCEENKSTTDFNCSQFFSMLESVMEFVKPQDARSSLSG